ncbi:MAG: LEA14-like dessication related protein [Myxococcota bacterium]|jgi:LEA14-like dessication related protein
MTHLMRLCPLVILAAGCTDGGSSFFDIEFDRLDVENIDFQEVEADFVFRVNNRTPLGFRIANFDYALAFEQIEWLSGEEPEGLTLYADDYSEISLPLNIIFQDIYDVVQATRGEDNIDFGLGGNFGIKLSQESIIVGGDDSETEETGTEAEAKEEVANAAVGESVSIPYDADGDFPALRRPRFSFKKLKVGTVDWSNFVAPVTLKLNVENDHASSLFLTNFDYNLSLGGSAVASGLVDDLGEVLGASLAEDGVGGAAVLSIPINLDLGSLGSTVYDAILGGGNLAIGLDASTDVDTPFGVVTLSIDETGDISVE